MFNTIQRWFKTIGTYRIIVDRFSYKYPAYIVEVQGLMGWHVVKTFVDEDVEYARLCANELLETLEAKI